jgi:hypothetical protein
MFHVEHSTKALRFADVLEGFSVKEAPGNDLSLRTFPRPGSPRYPHRMFHVEQKISTQSLSKPAKLGRKMRVPHVLHSLAHFCTGPAALPPKRPLDTLL